MWAHEYPPHAWILKLENNWIWKESSLELENSLFDGFWIGALELIFLLIRNWKMFKFHMDPAWSSEAHYVMEYELKINQMSYESGLEL